MKWLKLLILFFFTGVSVVNSQDIPQKVIDGFNLGNEEFISPHLSEEVEVILPEEEGLFSKDLTNRKLSAFFYHHPPLSFNIVHHGKSPSGAVYGIGELLCKNDNWRVYIFLSGAKNTQVSEIRIESND